MMLRATQATLSELLVYLVSPGTKNHLNFVGNSVRYRNTLCLKKFLKVINNLGAGTSYMYVIANLCNSEARYTESRVYLHCINFSIKL